MIILRLYRPLDPRQARRLRQHLRPLAGYRTLAFAGQDLIIAADSAFAGDPSHLAQLDFVQALIPCTCPFPLASYTLQTSASVVKVKDLAIGRDFTVCAGPCSLESPQSLIAAAQAVSQAGARILRAGAYKPRSSPYDFQGLGAEGIKILKNLKSELTLPLVSEVSDSSQIPAAAEALDILQVGARNMQNYELLKALALTAKPILLKRDPAKTVTNFLMSAEYLLAFGNPRVILCERGSKTGDPTLPIAFDLNIVQTIKKLTHLPLLVDPSHAAGTRQAVPLLAESAVRAGADGLMIEVHQDPDQAITDGATALSFSDFADLMNRPELVTSRRGKCSCA